MRHCKHRYRNAMDSSNIAEKTPNRCDGEQGFKDKVVFITGGTGFLGKLLVEKLLRTCPSVGKIYLLIRDKKGLSSQSRLKNLFSNPLFDLLKRTRGEKILEKVFCVSGDVLLPNLGISKEARQILTDEVHIIYHMAASIRFDLSFKDAVLFNTKGTKLVLDLARECKNLLVFHHVSTAYVCPKEEILYEKTYTPPTNPHTVLKIIETMDDNVIEAVGKILMYNYPNTYTVSKALAEGLVYDEMNNLPVVVHRPSIVIPIWKEPIPGWSDNVNGPLGLMLAAGKGILRTMYGNKDAFADFIPGDVVVNGLITMNLDYLTNKERRIYNLTSTGEVQVTWDEMIETGMRVLCTDMPLNWAVWYPGISIKSTKLVYHICSIPYHYIPAVFLDFLIILSGNKPVLWKIQRRLSLGASMVEYYLKRKWVFNNDNTAAARQLLNQTEREIYKIDSKGYDLDEYFYNALHSARLYIFREGDESIPTAKRHLKVMWALDRISKLLLIAGFLYLIYKYFIHTEIKKLF